MAIGITARFTLPNGSANDFPQLNRTSGDIKEILQSLDGIIWQVLGGAKGLLTGGAGSSVILDLMVGASAPTHASQTYTFSAAPANNDTFTINGAAITAKTSGASGDQFNIPATAGGSAAALATAINASATAALQKVVFATAAGQAASGTVTSASVVAGNILNVGQYTFTVVSSTTGTSFDQTSNFTANVKVGGSDSAMTLNFQAAVNALMPGLVRATVSSNVMTLTASISGSSGNAIGLTRTGAPITLSGAALANGVDPVGASNWPITDAAGVCRVWAKATGTVANAVTTAKSSANTAVGGATLSGGVGDDVIPVQLTYA